MHTIASHHDYIPTCDINRHIHVDRVQHLDVLDIWRVCGPKNITGILNELKAFAQSPLRVIVMSKSVGNSQIAFARRLVACPSQTLSVPLPFISFEVEFCGRHMRRCQPFQPGGKRWRTPPIIQRLPGVFCVQVSL